MPAPTLSSCWNSAFSGAGEADGAGEASVRGTRSTRTSGTPRSCSSYRAWRPLSPTRSLTVSVPPDSSIISFVGVPTLPRMGAANEPPGPTMAEISRT